MKVTLFILFFITVFFFNYSIEQTTEYPEKTTDDPQPTTEVPQPTTEVLESTGNNINQHFKLFYNYLSIFRYSDNNTKTTSTSKTNNYPSKSCLHTCFNFCSHRDSRCYLINRFWSYCLC